MLTLEQAAKVIGASVRLREAGIWWHCASTMPGYTPEERAAARAEDAEARLAFGVVLQSVTIGGDGRLPC